MIICLLRTTFSKTSQLTYYYSNIFIDFYNFIGYYTTVSAKQTYTTFFLNHIFHIKTHNYEKGNDFYLISWLVHFFQHYTENGSQGLGSMSLSHINEKILKMSIQKLFNLGHPQNKWLRWFQTTTGARWVWPRISLSQLAPRQIEPMKHFEL